MSESQVFNELTFLENNKLPLPKNSASERMQILMAFRNERKLFWRNCSLTNQRILSSCREDVEFPVYNLKDWWNTQHSKVGLEYDFNKPFFEQLAELSKIAVRPAMEVHYSSMENSEYCNCANNLKDCYMLFEATNSEKCYFSRGVYQSNNCLECLNITQSSFCYNCIDCINCYDSWFLQSCKNCNECRFGRDLQNCANCFFCTNLVNKEYCIFNKQVSRSDYFKFINEFKNNKIDECRNKFKEFEKSQFSKDLYILNSENASGNYIKNSKNIINSFDVSGAENILNCHTVSEGDSGAYNCVDILLSFLSSQNCYYSHAVGMNSFNIFFSDAVWGNVRDVFYSQLVVNGSSNCFGCISLVKSQNCILNKQYTKHEYEKLIPKIINHMKETKEWGSFLPKSIIRYCYNDSIAQDYYPLNKSEIEANGYKFGVDIQSNNNQNECLSCSKAFKITKIEKEFYDSNKINYPENCFECRHKERLKARRENSYFKSNCSNCNKDIITSKNGIIYCSECYQSAVFE